MSEVLFSSWRDGLSNAIAVKSSGETGHKIWVTLFRRGDISLSEGSLACSFSIRGVDLNETFRSLYQQGEMNVEAIRTWEALENLLEVSSLIRDYEQVLVLLSDLANFFVSHKEIFFRLLEGNSERYYFPPSEAFSIFADGNSQCENISGVLKSLVYLATRSYDRVKEEGVFEVAGKVERISLSNGNIRDWFVASGDGDESVFYFSESRSLSGFSFFSQHAFRYSDSSFKTPFLFMSKGRHLYIASHLEMWCSVRGKWQDSGIADYERWLSSVLDFKGVSGSRLETVPFWPFTAN